MHDARQLQVARFLLVLLLLEVGKLQVNGASSSGEGGGALSKPSTQWRVINLDVVTYGWAVGELRMYSDTKCTEDLTAPPVEDLSKDADEIPLKWTAISSGDNNAPPSRAFDSLTWTEWRAACYMCAPGQAWVGIQFNKPVEVFCISLYQWGKREYMTAQVMLQRWEAGPALTGTGVWQDVLKGMEMGGETWDKIGFTLCDPLPAPDHGRVTVTNGGFWPSEATFSCSGARLMVGANKQSCSPDGTWPEVPPACWPAIALVSLVVGIFTIELMAFGLYYIIVVMNKPPPLQQGTYVPDDAMGAFTSDPIYGVNEVEEDDGSKTRPRKVLLHVLGCFCCRVADTWHSVGMIPFFVGVWIPQLCLPCLPCVGLVVRFQMRSRFLIPGTISRDLFLWTCCMPCVATQEAKHVDHLCDVAEEEAVVMKHAEERKREKEQKIREALEEKATKIGKDKDKDDNHHHHKKDKDVLDHHIHPDFLKPKSVMDILATL